MSFRGQVPSSSPFPRQKRIAIVRALPGLGDFLCAVPAWRAVRAAWPEAHITLIGLPAMAALTSRFGHYIDAFQPFPGFPGIPEGPGHVRDLPAFLAAAQADPFDLVLQMHGSGIISNAFALLLGGRVTAGCYVPGHLCPDPATFLPYPEEESEIWRLLRLVEFLDYPLQGDDLEFPLAEADVAAYDELARRYHLRPGQVVCLHPGASQRERRLPPAAVAAIGDRLSGLGYRVALTGTAAEADLTGAVSAQMRHAALDLTGQTSLGALALLLRDAALVVSNDTGVSHLAAAVRAPSVIVFTHSDPRRWAPLDRVRHRVVDWRGRLDPADSTGRAATGLAEAVVHAATESFAGRVAPAENAYA